MRMNKGSNLNARRKSIFLKKIDEESDSAISHDHGDVGGNYLNVFSE